MGKLKNPKTKDPLCLNVQKLEKNWSCLVILTVSFYPLFLFCR